MTLNLESGFPFSSQALPQSEYGAVWLALAVCLAAGVPAMMFAVNVWLFRRPGREWNKRPLPRLSVLIPARNEEGSIGAAIDAVLHSRGVDFEVVCWTMVPRIEPRKL